MLALHVCCCSCALYNLRLLFPFYALKVTIYGISTLSPDAMQTPSKHRDMLLPSSPAFSSRNRNAFLLCPSGRPSLLQLLIYSKDECRAGYRSCDCDAASTVHAFDTMLLPKRFSDSAKCGLSTSQLLDILRLHPRLDGIGRVEHEVVGSTCDGTRGHALPDWKIFLLS